MTKVSKPIYPHEIGYRVIGGVEGHEHIHPTGEQVCLNCGKSLEKIIKKRNVKCTSIGILGFIDQDSFDGLLKLSDNVSRKALTKKTLNKLIKKIWK